MAVASALPMLTWEELPNGAEVLGSPGKAVKSFAKEAAGRSFHAAALAAAGLSPASTPTKGRAARGARIEDLDDCDDEDDDDEYDDDESEEEEDDDEEHAGEDTAWAQQKKKTKKGGKDAKEEELKDLYALLGLGNERWNASDKQIEKAYRNAALKFHPDKCGIAQASEAEKERIEAHFKDIQEAYNTLSDPQKRREYDSMAADDEVLPTKCGEGEFYEVFGAACLSLSRWSTTKPVPTVGDAKTEYKKVEDFYNFWYHKFKSWREFPHEDEHNLEEADGREHKRWMQRENERMRREAKREETAKIRAFIEAMEEHDPRVIAHKAEEYEKRTKKKREKEAARQKKEEEDRLAAEQAAKDAAEKAEKDKADKADAKKNREKEKKLVRKERARLRALAEPLREDENFPGDMGVEKLCEVLGLEGLQALCEQLEGAAEEERALIMYDKYKEVDAAGAAIRAQQLAEAKAKADARRAKAEAEAAERAEDPWTEEELRLLDKAVTKYPKGTLRRWEQVAMAVRTRNEVEVKAKAEEREKAGNGSTGGQQSAYDQMLSSRKGDGAVASDVTYRAESLTDVDVNLAGDAAAAFANGVADAGDVWSEAQEMALVKAVKAFPKGCAPTEKERWAKVAEAVPGKNSAQCFKQFGVLRSKMAAAKGK